MARPGKHRHGPWVIFKAMERPIFTSIHFEQLSVTESYFLPFEDPRSRD